MVMVPRTAAQDPLAMAVSAYLAQAPNHRAHVTGNGPLDRQVTFGAGRWFPWLLNGGRPHQRGYCGPMPNPMAALATSLVAQLPRTAAGECRIDRPLLRAMAVTAQRGTPNDLVRLWLATMMWGGGSSDGRRPWRTAQGLAYPQLVHVLAQSATQVWGGTPGAAHGFAVPGSGESYFTKWLWASSLALAPGATRPLILDYRVRVVWNLVHAAAPVPLRGTAGYLCYLQRTWTAGAAVARGNPHVDGEKLEWLMFDRGGRDHPPFGEPCFVHWLRQGGIAGQGGGPGAGVGPRPMNPQG